MCYKIIYNFIVLKNLNKDKILYPQVEGNTDNKRKCVIRRRRDGVLQSIEMIDLYRSKKVEVTVRDSGLHTYYIYSLFGAVIFDF